MKGASFVIPLSWSDRVNQIEAQRAVQAQKMTLVGLGQPVDPLIWPIPDRFHALGIPTRGSCEGHWIPYSQRPLNPFVTVHGTGPGVAAPMARDCRVLSGATANQYGRSDIDSHRQCCAVVRYGHEWHSR